MQEFNTLHNTRFSSENKAIIATSKVSLSKLDHFVGGGGYIGDDKAEAGFPRSITNIHGNWIQRLTSDTFALRSRISQIFTRAKNISFREQMRLQAV